MPPKPQKYSHLQKNKAATGNALLEHFQNLRKNASVVWCVYNPENIHLKYDFHERIFIIGDLSAVTDSYLQNY